ncbi:uncharacterized protein LOC131149157 isoform X2 [Malania oleifera]|uniref:uncharacterized protein LOC131149157 isoform X2 n=1 Tax=Malania oleifera TaxID=397392 RepID=UPI0025AE4F51|nr:uncharacterized protein LOC131149157 isoform X2 [Malania oleifera]
MVANATVISFSLCAFPWLPPKPKTPAQTQNHISKISFLRTLSSSGFVKPCKYGSIISSSGFQRRDLLQICQVSLKPQNSVEEEKVSGNGGGGKGGRDWVTSILLFGLWAALIYYALYLAPDQTPFRDKYFLQKLLNLKGDDGFRMNEVLVSLWYLLGLWPLVYSMLLLPTGRSSKSNVPLLPFLILSVIGGAYALFPYFVLWKPPPPPIEETELRKWPLNFLESKFTAGITVAAGLALFFYAGLANGDVWKEFFQYFRESKFIHVSCIDFVLFSSFAPFWVFNDMAARKWDHKGYWLVPLSLVPFMGPALYLVLRPSLSAMPLSQSPTASKQK